MPRYKQISEDLHWVIVHMRHKRNLSVKEITQLTSVQERMVQIVLKLFHETGKVSYGAERRTRPGKLDTDDLDVCFHNPLKFCVFAELSQVSCGLSVALAGCLP